LSHYIPGSIVLATFLFQPKFATFIFFLSFLSSLYRRAII